MPLRIDGREYKNNFLGFKNQELVEKLLDSECNCIYIVNVEDKKKIQREITHIRIFHADHKSDESIIAFFRVYIKGYGFCEESRVHLLKDYGKTWSFEKLI